MTSRWVKRAVLGCELVAVTVLALGMGTTQGLGTPLEQAQRAWNTNDTDQKARAGAHTDQSNYNVPFAFWSPRSNGGDVGQSNDATTAAWAGNANWTDQSIDQAQSVSSDGSGCHRCDGGVDQGQQASNDNSTDQDAEANASTEQVNVNAPIAILSPRANSGDVSQSNDATTTAQAGNANWTDQSIGQSQDAQTDGRCGCGGSGDVSQDQEASNSNSTDQDAEANASTSQVNVNAPIAILSPGANGGDVSQSNSGTTTPQATNANVTDQAISQAQNALAT